MPDHASPYYTRYDESLEWKKTKVSAQTAQSHEFYIMRCMICSDRQKLSTKHEKKKMPPKQITELPQFGEFRGCNWFFFFKLLNYGKLNYYYQHTNRFPSSHGWCWRQNTQKHFNRQLHQTDNWEMVMVSDRWSRIDTQTFEWTQFWGLEVLVELFPFVI